MIRDRRPQGMTVDEHRWNALLSGTSITVVGLCAAALSYQGLHAWAVQTQVSPLLAWCYPLLVDGFGIAAMICIVQAVAQGISTTYSWVLVGISVAISTALNVISAAPTLVPMSWAVPVSHGLPPVLLALTAEQAVRSWRHRAGKPAPQRGQRRATTPVLAPTALTPPEVASAAPLAAVTNKPTARPTAKANVPASGGGLRADVLAVAAEHPDWGGARIAAHLGRGDRSYINSLLRESRSGQTVGMPIATGA